MPSSLTQYAALVKTRYNPDKVADLTQRDLPRYAMMKKASDFEGESMTVPVIYANPQGVAADIASARSVAASSNITGAKFIVTPGTLFGVVQIGDLVMAATKGNNGAFLANKLVETDGIYTQIGQDISRALWDGNGGVVLGQRASISTNTITLAARDDVYNFEVGMVVVASSGTGASGGDTLRTGSTTVTAIDTENGTVTVASAAAITSFADNDYIFRSGLFAGSTTNRAPVGLTSYITATSTPGTLFSLDRSPQPNRLAGYRVLSSSITGQSISYKFERLLTEMKGIGNVPGTKFRGWCNPLDWQSLQVELRSKGIQPMADDSAKWGFSKLQLVAGGAVADIFADPDCPINLGTIESPDTWKYSTIGETVAPALGGDAGEGLQRLQTGSLLAYELVIRSYGNQICNAPGRNGRVNLAA